MSALAKKSNYRARIFIRGCTEQKIYSSNLGTLRSRAIKSLTSWEPGVGACWPEKIWIDKRTFDRFGFPQDWDKVETITIDEIKEDAREYVKRRKEKETQIRMEADRIQLPLK